MSRMVLVHELIARLALPFKPTPTRLSLHLSGPIGPGDYDVEIAGWEDRDGERVGHLRIRRDAR